MSSLYYEDICSIIPDRAVGEDDDDLEDVSVEDSFKYAPVVWWSKVAKERIAASPNQCLNCDTLIIAVGPVASGFVSSYVMDKCDAVKTLGVVCSEMKDSVINSLGQRSPIDNSCFISSLVSQPDTIFVVCNSEVEVEHSFSWAVQVLSKACSSKTSVLVLTSSSMVEYKSATASDELPRNFLRSLSSSEFHGSSTCQPLEQPNISTGLPAQLLTYCQVHSIACLLCICYTAALVPEIETFKAFRPLLRSLPFTKLTVSCDEDAIRRIAELAAPRSRSTDQLFT